MLSTSPTEREIVALHEAAHAVVARRLGMPLHSIEVRCRSGETLLDGKWNPVPSDRATYEVAVFAAGRVAVILAGFESLAGDSDEREIRARAAKEPGCEARGRALAEFLLRSEWTPLRKLAAVAAYGYLTRQQAIDFIECAPVGPLPSSLARLRELGKRVGNCRELAAAPGFERLIELAADAPHRAERAALAAAQERELLAQLRALPPAPGEQVSARVQSVSARSDPKVAEIRRELDERMARLALAEAVTASRPKPIADKAHREWLERIQRGPRRRAVARSTPPRGAA